MQRKECSQLRGSLTLCFKAIEPLAIQKKFRESMEHAKIILILGKRDQK